MIKHYEKHKIMKDGTEYKLRTHLISPTIQANEIYQSLDSLDMKKDAHDDYSDTLLLNIIDDIKTEKKEYEKYIKSNGDLPIKEYRHNYPLERAIVVNAVQFVWRRVKNRAKLIDLAVNDATTDAAIKRFSTQAVDGYDLLLLETISKAGQFQVITDDIDYSVVPDIQVFTSNNRLIQEAATQNKLVAR